MEKEEMRVSFRLAVANEITRPKLYINSNNRQMTAKTATGNEISNRK